MERAFGFPHSFCSLILCKRSICMNESPSTLGVIIGNRDSFPTLVAEGAARYRQAVRRARTSSRCMLSPEETKLGGVETHTDARKCADLFRAERNEIDGVLVVLPNFGDEKGVADTLKMAGLNVPVLDPGLSRRLEPAWASRAAAMRSAERFPSATTSCRPASSFR